MTTRTIIALAALTVTISVIPARAFASFSTNTGAVQDIQTLLLQPPAMAFAATEDACARVTISWTDSGADSYRVEVREGAGPWTDMASTGEATSIEDTAGHAATQVTYRVFSRDSQSGWESEFAAESGPLDC